MRFFGKCLCALYLHAWQTDTKGRQIQGHIYTIQQRTCQRCGKTEVLKYDRELEDVIWDEKDSASK